MMRHPERKLKERETITGMLEKSSVGRIATVNRKGFPVIKPVNYLYWDGKIYIHSSMKGEKIRDIRRESPVCFEVDQPIAYVASEESACRAGYYYRSIVIKGEASLVKERKKKLEILERLMEKYQPEGGYGRMVDETLRRTAVIEISIQEITAKEKMG
ncbi:MAG: pyridoxamine 5'-phosphate oxidase family protein [Syntrophaceae bacterium]|nr:pyridoxamine 5'-phosphate oxidase family protein [Syntrophaceae bacterium]